MAVADVILLYTETEVAAFSRKMPKGPTVFALNNTLDPEPIARAIALWTRDRLVRFCREHGLEGRQVLLFCGRLRVNPSTDLDVAIRALSLLIEREGAAKYLLVVIGAGEDSERLRALTEDLGVRDSVRWQDPIYEENEIAPWFMSALCFVFPGAIGLSLIHSLSYGLPVITHSCRRLHGPEIAALEHERNGLLFERGDPAELCLQISRLASDQRMKERMSEAALEVVQTDFSFASMVRRFEAAIRKASEQAQGRRI